MAWPPRIREQHSGRGLPAAAATIGTAAGLKRNVLVYFIPQHDQKGFLRIPLSFPGNSYWPGLVPKARMASTGP